MGGAWWEGFCDVTVVTHLKHGVFTTDLSSGFAVHRGGSDTSWAARVTRCGLGLSTRRQICYLTLSMKEYLLNPTTRWFLDLCWSTTAQIRHTPMPHR